MSAIAPQLDYSKIPYLHPQYRYSKILPNTGLQSLSVTTAGGQSLIFEIPVKPINLSRSILSFTATYGLPGAGKFTWAKQDALALIQEINFSDRMGKHLAQITNVAQYSALVNDYETSFADFKTMDSEILAGQYFSVSNDEASVNVRHDNTTASVNYDEQLYFRSGADNGAIVYTARIPLDMLKNSIFELDKDLLFKDIMIMTITFNPSTYAAFISNAEATVNTPASFPSAIALSSIQLEVAVDINPQIVQEMNMKRDSAEGISFLCPYVYSYKQGFAATTTSQSVSLRYSRIQGARLVKILYAVFGPETANTFLEHTNVGAAKITSFYTQLNGQRNEEINMACALGDDYRYMLHKLKGTPVLNSDIYNYNWCYISSFSGHDDQLSRQHIAQSKWNFEQGISLDEEKKWDMYITSLGTAVQHHYAFAIVQKMVKIDQNGVSIF